MANPTPVANSSWVSTIDYSNGLLTVTTKKGRRLTYIGVPSSVWFELEKSPSKGEFINRSIKGKFKEL